MTDYNEKTTYGGDGSGSLFASIRNYERERMITNRQLDDLNCWALHRSIRRGSFQVGLLNCMHVHHRRAQLHRCSVSRLAPVYQEDINSTYVCLWLVVDCTWGPVRGKK